MGPERFNSLFEAMDIIEAQEQLKCLVISDWPSLKSKRRSEIIKSLDKRARALAPKKKLEFTAEALKELISG